MVATRENVEQAVRDAGRMERTVRRSEELVYAGRMRVLGHRVGLLIRAGLEPEAMSVAQSIEAESVLRLRRLGETAA